MDARVGEYHRSFKTAPQIIAWVYKSQTIKKKFQNNASKRLQIAFKVFLLPIALPQGQLKEVPIYFKNVTIKVVGQTIQACSATKISKL